MKQLSFLELEKVSGEGDGQDFVGGILCGLAIGSAIGSGGFAMGLAIFSCASLFGDW